MGAKTGVLTGPQFRQSADSCEQDAANSQREISGAKWIGVRHLQLQSARLRKPRGSHTRGVQSIERSVRLVSAVIRASQGHFRPAVVSRVETAKSSSMPCS